MVRFRIESNCFILHTFLGYIYIPGTYLDKDSLGGAENSNHNAMIGMRCACMRNHWWLHLHIIWASNASFCFVFCHAQAKVEGKTHVVKHTYSSENHGFLNWLKGKVTYLLTKEKHVFQKQIVKPVHGERRWRERERESIECKKSLCLQCGAPQLCCLTPWTNFLVTSCYTYTI